MPEVVIFDLDGVLADMLPALEEHIFNHEEPDWHAFNAARADAEPVACNVALARLLSAKHLLFVLTNRGEDSREMTTRWLMRHGIQFDRLIMRPVGVMYHDFKCGVIARLQREFDVAWAIDDDRHWVREFTAMGVPTTFYDSGHHDRPHVPGLETADAKVE